jgi:hypothetical protein
VLAGLKMRAFDEVTEATPPGMVAFWLDPCIEPGWSVVWLSGEEDEREWHCPLEELSGLLAELSGIGQVGFDVFLSGDDHERLVSWIEQCSVLIERDLVLGYGRMDAVERSLRSFGLDEATNVRMVEVMLGVIYGDRWNEH